jgi:hypothetical protein
MTDWIKGRELLEPPYNATRQDIFKAVQEGNLVPWTSPDYDWIKRHGSLEDPEQIVRTFPNDELQEKYKRLLVQQEVLEKAQRWSRKSDEECIEAHKHDIGLNWVEKCPLPDLETYVNETLPVQRQKELQVIQEYPSQIEELMEELAPDKVWKDLELGIAQQDILMDKLLDASYPLDQVEAIMGAKSQKTFISKAKTPKLKVPPGTQWEDIEITLISDDTVRIKTPDREERFTYHELGLSDKRKGDAPTMLWRFLKVFAQNDGFICRENPDYDPLLPDSAKRLNKHLQNLFGIKESIYSGHYKRVGGYKTKIKFSDQTF